MSTEEVKSRESTCQTESGTWQWLPPPSTVYRVSGYKAEGQRTRGQRTKGCLGPTGRQRARRSSLAPASHQGGVGGSILHLAFGGLGATIR